MLPISLWLACRVGGATPVLFYLGCDHFDRPSVELGSDVYSS